MRRLPRYKCYEEVEALEIERVEGGTLHFKDKEFPPLTRGEFVAQWNPMPGSWLVIHKDGSWTNDPGERFRDNYLYDPPAHWTPTWREMKAHAGRLQSLLVAETWKPCDWVCVWTDMETFQQGMLHLSVRRTTGEQKHAVVGLEDLERLGWTPATVQHLVSRLNTIPWNTSTQRLLA